MRSTRTSRGCAAGPSTGGSPRRSRAAAATAARSPGTGSPRASPTARSTRCWGRSASAPRSTPTATRPRLGRRALDLWPEGERGAERIAVLEEHARCAELAGELAEAARAQREVVGARRAEGAGRALADAERRMAAIYALQGDRERALAARRVAAESYAANGLPGEAASERLVIGGLPAVGGPARRGGRGRGARRARRRRAPSASTCRRGRWASRAWRARRAEPSTRASRPSRRGLSLALEHELTREAAEVYQRLGTAREVAGDYGGARDALDTALGLCELSGQGGLEQVCLSCMAYVLRELGDWDRCDELCRELIVPGAPPQDTLVADGVLGSLHAWRGDAARGAAAADALPRDDGAPRRRLDAVRQRGRARRGWRRRRATRSGPRSTAASCSRAGSAARTTTTRCGGCAGRRAGSPDTGGLGARPRLLRGALDHRRLGRPPRRPGGPRVRARRDRAGGRRRRRGDRPATPARSRSTRPWRSRSSGRRS